MNNIYLGSDWHFSRFRKKTKSMKYDFVRSKDILSKYKTLVDNDDLFIFLGDLSYVGQKNTGSINNCLESIKYLPGKKIFIRGNNDEASRKYYKNLGFDLVETSLVVDDVLFTHIPKEVKGNMINIHGHIHGSGTYWDCEPHNHVDCFTGLFAQYPIKLEPLLFNGKYIDKSLLTDSFFDSLKKHLFELV